LLAPRAVSYAHTELERASLLKLSPYIFQPEFKHHERTQHPFPGGTTAYSAGMIRLALLLIAALLFLAPAGPALAADATNPAGTTIAGDWDGTADDDNYDNQGTVTGDVDMTQGGSDTLTNSGTVGGDAVMSSDGSNSVNNQAAGTMGSVLGSYNENAGNSGGSNTITNTGTAGNLWGSVNEGANSSGGSNTITNSGTADVIVGSDNEGSGSSGGSNNITNTGTVNGDIYGSFSDGTITGGGNTITNSGTAGYLAGSGSGGDGNTINNQAGGTVSHIIGSASAGGGHTTTNAGTVSNHIYGSWNTSAGGSGGSNTISNSGTVSATIYGSLNQGAGASGGSNSITNSGTAGAIYGSRNEGASSTGGSNSITNSNLALTIVGNDNRGDGSSGGGNTITNSNANVMIFGTVNSGAGSSGGGNTISNSGTVNDTIYGNDNVGDGSSGGSNTITNSGLALAIVGNDNRGDGSSGGGNTITNAGTVSFNIWGSDNGGANSSGGGNTITNSGTVSGNIYGSRNSGVNSTSSGNIIENSGIVTGSIYGSNNTGAGSSGGDDSITNSGSVGGSIYGEDGDDTVTMQTGPGSVGGNIDGGPGTDTIVYSGGTWAANDPKVINFENTEINATHDLTLTGAWSLSGAATVGPGGSLGLGTGVSLSVASLEIAFGGTMNIYGTTSVAGATTVGGTLNVNSGGILDTGSLGINSGGTMSVDGTTSVAGATTVGGTLDVNSSGSMSTADLNIYSTGVVNIAGTMNVSSSTYVGGILNVTSNNSLNTSSLEIVAGCSMNVDGTTTVSEATSNAGSLKVNGTLNTASLSNSGTLSGTGTINGGVSNSGVISPGNSIGTLTIGGNLTNTSSGVLAAEVSSDGSSDRLRVTGTARLNGGYVSTNLPVALYTHKFGWDILTAGSVVGSFAGVRGQPDSQTLSLHAVSYADKVTLEVWRTPFADLGANAMQTQSGAGLDGIIAPAKEQGDGMANLIIAMDFGYDLAQIQQALQALSPEMYDAFSAAGMQAAEGFAQAMARRSETLRDAKKLGWREVVKGQGLVASAAEQTTGAGHVAQAQPTGGWSLWARALGSWLDQDASGGHLGYKLTSGGVVLGADGPVLPWLRLGFSFGAGSTDIDWSRGNYSGDQRGVHGGLYAAADLGDFYLDASLSYGTYDNNATRPINFSSVSTQAKASFDGQSYLALLGGGYDIKAGGVVFGPTLALNFLQVEQDGFSESGADFLSLSVQKRTDDYFISALGFKAATIWRSGKVSFLPRLSVAWRHNFTEDARAIVASYRDYGSSSFTVTGVAPASDVFTSQLGLDVRLSESFSAYAQCGIALGDDLNAQEISAGLDWLF
jgi:uncharacterized protein with beta-barrel porin domain